MWPQVEKEDCVRAAIGGAWKHGLNGTASSKHVRLSRGAQLPLHGKDQFTSEFELINVKKTPGGSPKCREVHLECNRGVPKLA